MEREEVTLLESESLGRTKTTFMKFLPFEEVELVIGNVSSINLIFVTIIF